MTLRGYDQEVLLKWFFYRITPEQRHALSREHPEAYNRYCGEEIVQVVGTSDNLSAYWTVVLPYQAAHTDGWFPHEPEGPFSTLTRGAFRSEEHARTWIEKNLPKDAKYEIRRIACLGPAFTP